MSKRTEPYPRLLKGKPVDPERSNLPQSALTDKLREACDVARYALRRAGYTDSPPPPSCDLAELTVPWASAQVLEAIASIDRAGESMVAGMEPSNDAWLALMAVCVDVGYYHGLLYALLIEEDAQRGVAVKSAGVYGKKGGPKGPRKISSEELRQLAALPPGRQAAAIDKLVRDPDRDPDRDITHAGVRAALRRLKTK